MNIRKFNEDVENWAEPFGGDVRTQKVMLKWDADWADEMSIAGFVIVPRTTADDWRRNIEAIDRRFHVCIGTNEEMDYRNGNQLLREIEEIDIDDATYRTFVEIFGEGRLWYRNGGNGIRYGFTQFFRNFGEDN